MLSVVILISGRGSNMEAILNANLPLTVKAVIANKASATGLQIARDAGIETRIVDHLAYPSREAFDDANRRAQVVRHGVAERGLLAE
jgi:phosphoribosylglycinamide formyltransferase-1